MGDLRPEDVTWEELRDHGEGRWRLTGPNSGGGTDLYRYKGQLFIVGYGDYGSLPDGAEKVIGVLPDNTPGFPPMMASGHAAGCTHDPPPGSDWWMHGVCLLRMQHDTVQLFENAKETWSCPLDAFVREGSPYSQDVLRKLGPAVLEEALRCAARRLRR